MAKRITPARWAVERFGPEVADVLVRRLPVAIHAAVGRQMDTHAAAKVRSRRAFAGAWEAKLEELERHLEDMPGFQGIRPRGRDFNVSSVNGVLLLPLHYAYDLATPHTSTAAYEKINKTSRELLHAYGPEPEHIQLSLDGLSLPLPDSGTDALGGFEPEGVVFVHYAAHERDGLLKIGWGEIVVDEFGMRWLNSQPLEVPAADMIPGLAVLTPVGSNAALRLRFDDAPMAQPIITPRIGTAHPIAVSTEDAAQQDMRSDARP